MTNEQKQNIDESKEAISKVIMLMKTIAIDCHHAKTCWECPHILKNWDSIDTTHCICGLDIGSPIEWDTSTLRDFQAALNHSVELTITKGDETQ